MQEKEQQYAKSTFDDVADKYDEIPFFKISAGHIAQIIKEAKKDENIQILDVACGTGNVTLACADSLPSAIFHAVDISEGMIEKCRKNVKEKQLENVTFQVADVTKLTLDDKYDIIVCAYALFFLPEPHRLLQKLVSLLKENGLVIFSSFTPKAFSVSDEILLPLLKKYGSSTALAYDPDKWENLKYRHDIAHLCTLAEVKLETLESREIRYSMSIDAWWELMNNTGYKGMLMELSTEDYEALKSTYYHAMFSQADMDGEVELVADSWYATVH